MPWGPGRGRPKAAPLLFRPSCFLTFLQHSMHSRIITWGGGGYNAKITFAFPEVLLWSLNATQNVC